MSPPISGTGISVVTDRTWSLHVFYQLLDGHVQQSKHVDGVWSEDPLPFSPVAHSPLASITYGSGREIRVYYLDSNSMVQEYCHSPGRGWYPGEIGHLHAKANPRAGLAAIAYGKEALGEGENGVHIRVYYQPADTNNIEELANDGPWKKGDMHISNALSGTSLAAVAYYFQSQTQIRLYYQAQDMCLREHGHNNGGWFTGEFKSGEVTARTPICALAFSTVQLQVYYRDRQGHLVYVKNTGAWGRTNVIEGIGPGHNFAVLQWENGTLLRIYHQESSGAITELCSDNGGQSWFRGELRVGN